MKRALRVSVSLILFIVLAFGAAVKAYPLGIARTQLISVRKLDGLPEDFFMGADISSLLSLEASGRVFYGFDGREQDIFKTLSESGVNCIRVRVWNDPFDENGNGYGGGNCTVDTAIAIGKRAAEYGMGLLVDFHYSDFWADPGKQQAPKEWKSMTLSEKTSAIYDYTADSVRKIKQSGANVIMVQVGNETNNGLCGETDKLSRYTLMRSAAKAVRDTDADILIATHFTNPESADYTVFAEELETYGVDHDVFSTSYYPEYHGSIYRLKEQLCSVHSLTGKKVMIAETSWGYSSDTVGAYKRSVQGQADEIAACVRAMVELGDYAIGVFYWEPAWIDAPGETEAERSQKREACGAGWASSYSASYDPDDAGLYYGATACIPTALFDPEGHPLESLRTFLYLRKGTAFSPENHVEDPSFENSGISRWKIGESSVGTVSVSSDTSNARDGNSSLHFWSDKPIDITVEQTVSGLPDGEYGFSLSVQGDGAGDGSPLKLFAISGGVRYEKTIALDGWQSWKVPMIDEILCSNGEITVGVEIKAAPGAWGYIDCVELIKEPPSFIRGDADGDGEVTILDATRIQRKLAGFSVDPFRREAADINSNGLDITDATGVQRFLAGFSNVYNIGTVRV